MRQKFSKFPRVKKTTKLCVKRPPDTLVLSRMNKKYWKASLIDVTKQGSGWFSHFDPPTRIAKVSR